MAAVVNLEELAELGFTVVRGFMSPAECARARAAIDEAFGPAPVESVPHELGGFPSQTGSSAYFHTVCHPHPVTLSVVDCVPKLVDVHCEVLRSNRANIKLNGCSLIRTDPWQCGPLKPHTNPTNIHIDNACAYLPSPLFVV
jgi:hypothetical protein